MKQQKYPFVNYKSFPKKSPEICIATLLQAWKDRQESRMRKFYTKTYIETHIKNPPQRVQIYDHEQNKAVWADLPKGMKTLDQAFRSYFLHGAEILEIKPPENQKEITVICDVKLKLWIRTPHDDEIKIIEPVVRMIKEKVPYKTDASGDWGVNPPSMYSIFDKIRSAANK